MTDSFFEFREKLTRRADRAADRADYAGRADGSAADAAGSAAAPSESLASSRPSQEPLTVSQLTRQIDRALRDQFPQTLLIKGEISNFNQHTSSGHLYFTLKDADACIDCVMWRSDAQRLKFDPEDGMELLARGGVKVYPQRGRYQLYVTSLQPLGKGALEVAFQQLRAKLEREGLFDAGRKKPLPPFPQRLAVVTGRDTAALHDMLKVLRRFPWLRVFVYAVPVQGDGAGEKVAAALNHLSRRQKDVGGIDVILLGRGGGSLEDLWAFNEECVARAVAASSIPVVTGIGHEVDVAIADLVADHHAHTPTEAAQVVTANWRNAADGVDTATLRLRRALRALVQHARQRLDGICRHELFRRPLDGVNTYRQLVDDRERSLRIAMNSRIWNLQRDLKEIEAAFCEYSPLSRVRLLRQRVAHVGDRIRYAVGIARQRRTARLDALERELRAVSPHAVLRRGYSMTTLKKDGAILRSAQQVKGGEKLVTRLADGTIESVAEDPRQPKLFD